jgi:hypothetical protein
LYPGAAPGLQAAEKYPFVSFQALKFKDRSCGSKNAGLQAA